MACPLGKNTYTSGVSMFKRDITLEGARAVRHFNLTRREYEVLMWAARGRTYADIGLILNLTFGTVKTHLDTMRLKLRANNIPHAIAIAFATELITADEFSQRTTLSDFADQQTLDRGA